MSKQQDLNALLQIVDKQNKQISKLQKELNKYKDLFEDSLSIIKLFDLDSDRSIHKDNEEWKAYLLSNWEEEQEGKRLSRIAHRKEKIKNRKGKK